MITEMLSEAPDGSVAVHHHLVGGLGLEVQVSLSHQLAVDSSIWSKESASGPPSVYSSNSRVFCQWQSPVRRRSAPAFVFSAIDRLASSDWSPDVVGSWSGNFGAVFAGRTCPVPSASVTAEAYTPSMFVGVEPSAVQSPILVDARICGDSIPRDVVRVRHPCRQTSIPVVVRTRGVGSR